MKRVFLPLFMLLCGVLSADSPKVFFRLKLDQVMPEGHPVRAAVSIFPDFRFFPWMTFGKFGVGKESGKIPFSTEFAAQIPWNDITARDMFRAGELSPWIDITDELAVAKGETPRRTPFRKTLCIAFEDPQLPLPGPGNAPRPNPIRRGGKTDRGNVRGVRACLEFASAPTENAVVKKLQIASDSSVISVVLDGTLDEKKKRRRLSEFTRIRSLEEDLREELDYLCRNIPVPAETLKKCTSASWVHHGYHFNLYDSGLEKIRMASLRRMGFNYINWYITPPENRKPDGLSFQFIEFPTGPEWLLKSPYHPVPDEEAIRQIRTILDRWFTEYGIDRTREVLCRVGDEIKLIPEDLLYAEKECPERFRAFLREKGEAVQGTEKPVRRKDIRNAADARLYYFSCMFRHQETLNFWKKYMSLMRRAFGTTPVRFGMESCGISYDVWPDYQEMSAVPLMDYFIHEFTCKMWIPPHYMDLKAARFASAAKYGKEEAGALMAPNRVATETGNELTGTQALSRGFRHVFFYMSFSEDNSTRNDRERPVARFNRRFAALENLLLTAESSMNTGSIALGVSEASEVWRSNDDWRSTLTFNLSRGVQTERHFLASALARTQLPFDYLTEPLMEKYLSRYTVLILPDPNLSRSARKCVAEWVRNGGRLLTVAGSAALDEFNQPHRLQTDLNAGLSDKVKISRGMSYGEYDPVLFRKSACGRLTSVSGKPLDCFIAREELLAENGDRVLASWENGAAAAVERKIGKGTWIHLGFLPGAAAARSSSAVFLESMKHYWQPELQADQYSLAPELMAFCTSLFPEEMNARRIYADRIGIETALFENGKKGAVILSDWHSSGRKTVRVFLPRGVWQSCRTEDGAETALRTDSQGIQYFDTELTVSQVLFLNRENHR